MNKIGAVVLLCAWVFAGCTTTAVTLRHADGRTVLCGPYPATGLPATAGALRERGCIEDFHRQGFLRISE